MPLLEANNLTLLKGSSLLLRHFHLHIDAGQIIHLTGDNGSGKTSLLQALAGLITPQGGQITRHCPLLYLGHRPGIKNTSTARENLRDAARLYHGMPHTNLEQRLNEALNAVGLPPDDHRQSRYLSAGQQRRCQLARLWLTTPPLWLLDEPLTALDATTTTTLLQHLEQHRHQGGAVIITSHQPLALPHMETRQLGIR
ncbi:MAG: heme ABC exporter ATP-binding protein CcmA [Cardiobacteriaceae bacterium]|nr:heme ABC exporter ATP-binding protein CcmA [Cardiobacteriaceae bacterium]